MGIKKKVSARIFSEESLEDVKITIDKYLAPSVLGEDVFDVGRMIEKMNAVIKGHTYAKAAIELALWDAIGKALKIPTYKLLGGLYREKIPVVWILGIGKPDQMAAEAQKYVEEGFTTIKVKIGVNPQQDLQNAASIRTAIGDDPHIRVDAIKTLRKMEKYNLELIEQPAPRWDLEGMAQVAKALVNFTSPLMAFFLY